MTVRTKNDLKELIQISLMFYNFDNLDEYLEDSIKAGIKPSIIRNGYEHLGDFPYRNKRWLQAAKAYESGRKIVRNHPRQVRKVLQALSEFWSGVKAELTVNDLVAFSRFIEDILADYQRPDIRNFYGPAIEIGEVMLGEMAARMDEASSKTKSRFSGELMEFIISKYAYLTDEERAKEFGRIMGKALRKLERNKKHLVKNPTRNERSTSSLQSQIIR